MTTRRISRSRLHVNGEVDKLTHYLFRYPAKFHPPVARTLIQRYTSEGDTILDPFAGSGTLLVEAAAAGRSSIGVDTDPVAVAVARAKVHRYKIGLLHRSAARVLGAVQACRRSPDDYSDLMFTDLAHDQYEAALVPVRQWVPAIPNLLHWFRRYVIVDLARIRQVIEEAHIPEAHRELFDVVFASIIRNSSNADPVPVSGLEVTAYMKRRDKEGRLVDPFGLFERALNRALVACEAFAARARPSTRAMIIRGDATRLGDLIDGKVDAVITSPPYHGAVDYYRRHKLEMFWLGHTTTAQDRLLLLRTYIGRLKVARSHPYVSSSSLETELAMKWERRIRRISADRADAFRHYIVAMTRFFNGLRDRVAQGAPTILVVGHSSWNGTLIPTTDLFAEIAGNAFQLSEVLWYPVKNRYMSYARHNGANINREYVLVFTRSGRR